MSRSGITVSTLDGGTSINGRRNIRGLTGSVVSTIVLTTAVFFGTAYASHIPTVGLGNAGTFAVLAGAGVTNTGPSVVQGDLGSSPNPAVSGFPPGLVQGGTINPAYTASAKDALVTAYDDASGRTPVTTIATELGGQTLTHGIYDSAAGTFGITGTLILDAAGDPSAVWIFKAASTLITGVGSNVSLLNGANPCNVFWVVGSSATLGVDSTFSGTIMSLQSITMNTGATLNGRALARNGAVTLDSNTISNSCDAPAPGVASVTTQVSSAAIALGLPVTDTATVAGMLAAPTRGSLLFNAYGPNDPTCAGAPAFTSTVPVTAAGNGNYTSAPFTPTAAGTYGFTVGYSGDTTNDPFVSGCGDPNETVVVTEFPPGVTVVKTVSPATLFEPGGAFSYTVALTNPSVGPVTITALTDDVYGNLATATSSTCDDLIGDVLVSGAGATCTFTGNFVGNAGDTETDVVTATVTGPGGQTASDTDDAVVTVTDAVPSITVDKTVDPDTRAEPGGLFTFTVTVTNTSVEVVRIASIVDNVYGDLGTREGSNCSDGINMSLAPGSEPNNSFTCTFSVFALGRDGTDETDTVTATAVDDESNVATASDTATISITAPAVRRSRPPAIVPGLVVQPPAPPSPPSLLPLVTPPAAQSLVPLITPPAAQTLLPAVTPQTVTAPPAAAVRAPATATPTAARRTLARTGSSTLPLLVLACNMIVLGLLLNSRVAGRRRYLI
jgi:hypothetical protein